MDLDGLLARGRGAGALAALERGPACRDSVLRQVIEDPRWDRQVESRDEYYASLLLALGSDVGPLVEVLERSGPDEAWLVRGVLLQLAIRDHLGALAALVQAARNDPDDVMLGELAALAGPERARELAALAGRRFVPAQPGARPSHALALEPCVRIDTLVELVRGRLDAGQARRVRAAARLGTLDHPALLDEAEAFLRAELGDAPDAARHAQRHVWLRYLESLPAARTLARARAWFDEPWPLSLAGQAVLIRHARPSDRPQLEQACAEALRARAMYRLCATLEALVGVAQRETIPLLVEVHDEIEYARARHDALVVLFELREHPEAHARLVEGLWDCEASTRALACEGVRVESATARLHELASDPWQDDEVREAARLALEKV